jgi:hypothetical protein
MKRLSKQLWLSLSGSGDKKVTFWQVSRQRYGANFKLAVKTDIKYYQYPKIIINNGNKNIITPGRTGSG